MLLYVMVCAITLVFSLDRPLSQLADIVTLRQRHSILDVLVLYVMLFVVAPLAAHLLARGRTWLLVAASVAVWGGFQFAPQAFDLPFLGGHGHFGFPLQAWQLLFCLAMAAGYHRAAIARKLTRVWRDRLLLVAGLTAVGLFVLYAHGVVPTHDSNGGLGSLFVKDSLPVGRLVATASVYSLLFAVLSLLGARAKAVAAFVLMPLGRHSLLAFALHLVAIVAITVAMKTTETDLSLAPLTSAGLQALAVLFVWLSIRLYRQAAEMPRAVPAEMPRPVSAARRLALVWQLTTFLLHG
jgi:hypothetical protein